MAKFTFSLTLIKAVSSYKDDVIKVLKTYISDNDKDIIQQALWDSEIAYKYDFDVIEVVKNNMVHYEVFMNDPTTEKCVARFYVKANRV